MVQFAFRILHFLYFNEEIVGNLSIGFLQSLAVAEDITKIYNLTVRSINTNVISVHVTRRLFSDLGLKEEWLLDDEYMSE